jgi:hypothetical protein
LDEKVRNEVRRVTKGVLIFDILVIIILLATSNFNKPIFTGLLFGSIFSILNFRLLALSLQKTLKRVPGKAQFHASSRYFVRFILTGLVIYVSVKAPHINVIGTTIGLSGPMIVILVTNLLPINKKSNRKEE